MLPIASLDFLSNPSFEGFSIRCGIADGLAKLPERATVEITATGKRRGAKVASVTRASDGRLDVTFGEWRTNPFRADLLSFEVAHGSPSTRYKSDKGAARAILSWLVRD